MLLINFLSKSINKVFRDLYFKPTKLQSIIIKTTPLRNYQTFFIYFRKIHFTILSYNFIPSTKSSLINHKLHKKTINFTIRICNILISTFLSIIRVINPSPSLLFFILSLKCLSTSISHTVQI